MNPAKAATVITFPILLTGFIRLKLRELLLQTALYRLAFLHREAELVETRSVDTAVDDCNLPTFAECHRRRQSQPRPSSSIVPSTSALSGKGLDYLKVLTPTFFPLPRRSA